MTTITAGAAARAEPDGAEGGSLASQVHPPPPSSSSSSSSSSSRRRSPRTAAAAASATAREQQQQQQPARPPPAPVPARTHVGEKPGALLVALAAHARRIVGLDVVLYHLSRPSHARGVFVS